MIERIKQLWYVGLAIGAYEAARHPGDAIDLAAQVADMAVEAVESVERLGRDEPHGLIPDSPPQQDIHHHHPGPEMPEPEI